jgi:8-amino-7-oxononanoate synthase
MNSPFDDIHDRLARLKRRSMYRHRRVVQSPQGRELVVDGQRLLNFCSNDYLGLANDERIRRAFKRGVDRWGVGAGASHLVCGHTAAHHELEEALAEMTGRPRALFFSSGYAANLGVINALVGARDSIFEDRLNHASLLDGGWISRARFEYYDHLSTDDLEARIVASEGGRRLIVSDGVFSMDGDRCPLTDLARLADRHDAWLMIDDAHGFGVIGERGAGTVDPDQFDTRAVPVLMATLGKAVGTSGAFVAGDDSLIEFLIQRSRNYIYTTALPAAVAEATTASLEIVVSERWRREKLSELITRFRQGVRDRGIDVMPSDTPIQPVIVGDAHAVLGASQALEDRGFLITAIRPPTVPQGSSRLRITLTAAHTNEDVDRLVSALGEVLGEVHGSRSDDVDGAAK